MTEDEARADALRWRRLVRLFDESVGGGLRVNDAALVYEKSEPGKRVELYWYPNTPIGSNTVEGDTLAEVVDRIIADETPTVRPPYPY